MKIISAIVMMGMMGVMAAEVGKVPGGIVVDGKLDEEAWKNAKWEGKFQRVKARQKEGESALQKTEFAILADEHTIYIGIKAHEKDMKALAAKPDASLWVSDNIELFLAPDGTGFEYYHFAVGPRSKDVCAEFYSESGNIKPDPFAPMWQHATAMTEGMWCAEFAIPLSAFYMTRNAGWKTKWLINVARTFTNPYDLASFAPLERQFHEPKNFIAVSGFPQRAAADDIAVLSAVAQMESAKQGQLAMEIFTAVAGEYEIIATGNTARRTLKRGSNKVKIPCSFSGNGRHATHIEVNRLSDGAKFARNYPVLVDFESIRVKLTTPQYRNNFYPEQDTSKVAGKVKIGKGVSAEVSLEGPGFAAQRIQITGESEFSFDTTGFALGDAFLTVKTNDETKRVRIRNLPKSNRQMAWIENGNLVVNGKPTLRRNMYAGTYMQGQCFIEHFKAEEESFCITKECEPTITLEPERLIKGLERKEATRDVKPCAEYFAKVDKLLESAKDQDFVAWYLCDEPECRNVSPVYLKYIYDYVAERDPYHPIFTASRGGKTYIECVDWAETHPYLNPYFTEDGKREYGRHPNDVGRFLDAFEAWDRPDKCIGFLPTCFAYRWSSNRNDYPTFDEYVLHTWAAMMRGGKTLWPYAGHDLGDRPALFEGTRYIFSSFAALENIVLNGKRSTFTKTTEEEGVVYELPNEKMFVVVNFTTAPRIIRLPQMAGNFREFRGQRKWRGGETVKLAPFETIVACTATHDKGLKSLAEVRKLIAKQEAERKGRDNQLRGRYDDLVVTSNMKPCFGGAFYKLIDGTRDMLGRYSDWITNAYIEVAFPKFTPRFTKVRVYGMGIENLSIDVRKGGAWRTLKPINVKRKKWMTELEFGAPVTTVKMRFNFPLTQGKRHIEIYELELPRCKGKSGAQAKQIKARDDKDVAWRLTANDVAATNVWSGNLWYGKDVKVSALASGGFNIASHVTRYFPLKPGYDWLVMDIAAFHNNPKPGYRAWSAHIDKVRTLGGTVTHPQAGLYTFRLPPIANANSSAFHFYAYGINADFNYIALMREPANYVDCALSNGVASVRAHFAAPCEDVSAEFVIAKPTGDMVAFPVNGSSGIELRALDEHQTIWGADVPIKSCTAAEPFQVYIKCNALGGPIARPIYANFTTAFEQTVAK